MKAAALRLATSLDGLSPHLIALILTVGFVLGTFPVFGCPTVLCLLAALALRLNLPALQLVNQLSSPLQYALLIPFTQLGARILGAPASWSLASAARQAVAGWACIAIPGGIVLYWMLAFLLRAYRPSFASHTAFCEN